MKGEKPLRATFPSSMHVHVIPLSKCQMASLPLVSQETLINIQQQDGNENINETIGLISKTTTLHLHHAFLGISLPFLYEIA